MIVNQLAGKVVNDSGVALQLANGNTNLPAIKPSVERLHNRLSGYLAQLGAQQILV